MLPQIDNYTLSLIISGRMPELDWVSFSPADWDLLVRRAQAEGVASLLYWNLAQSGKISSFGYLTYPAWWHLPELRILRVVI